MAQSNTPRAIAMRKRKAEAEAHTARMRELRVEGLAIAEKGICPACGNGLWRNLALSGWWLCYGSGEKTFRKAGHEADKHCTYQLLIPDER